MTYYGPSQFRPYVQAFWNPGEWLNGEWSKDDQEAFNQLYNFGVMGWHPFRDQFDTILDTKFDEHYMQRFGLEYNDIRDPRKLHQARNGSSNTLNFISSNVKHLYD